MKKAKTMIKVLSTLHITLSMTVLVYAWGDSFTYTGNVVNIKEINDFATVDDILQTIQNYQDYNIIPLSEIISNSDIKLPNITNPQPTTNIVDFGNVKPYTYNIPLPADEQQVNNVILMQAKAAGLSVGAKKDSTMVMVHERHASQIAEAVANVNKMYPDKAKLSAPLVEMLIMKESGGSPTASNNGHAIGLMQIETPHAGPFVAFVKEVYGVDVDFDNGRKNPIYNLAFGVKLLQGHITDAGGDYLKGLQAYNYGGGVLSLIDADTCVRCGANQSAEYAWLQHTDCYSKHFAAKKGWSSYGRPTYVTECLEYFGG